MGDDSFKTATYNQTLLALEICWKTKKDAPRLIVRTDVGVIDVRFGNDRGGLKHLIEQRRKDGTLDFISIHELFQAIAKSIALGQKSIQSQNPISQRIELSLGESSTILVKNKNENAWILSGWVFSLETLKALKEKPSGEHRSAYFNSVPTSESPTTSRTNGGTEGVDSVSHTHDILSR